jgi:hypothetical protein
MTDQIADRLQFENAQLRDEIERLKVRVEALENRTEESTCQAKN